MPLSYTEIFESFPPDLRLPIARLVDKLREELGVTRSDFEDLKEIVRDLAEAQKRTEARVEELAEAQKRTEDEFRAFRRDFASQLGGLGARWGLQTEGSFRQGMRAILREVGFATEQFVEYDAEGEVFGDPDQVELDIVIKNGRVLVVEIKSSLSRADINYFDRKVAFYIRKTDRRVDRKLAITPYADDRAKERARQLGIEIYTDVNAVE